jgi:SAM-dependent methyltransferase
VPRKRRDVESAADWLGRRHPLAYRLIRHPWRLLMRLLGRPTYWDARAHYRYYHEVVRLARRHVPAGGRVIDIGAKEAGLLRQLSWFESRLALDTQYVMPRPGVETVIADFHDYEPDGVFDLVLCLQVIEHLPRPQPFARKLLRTGRTVIISVPYRWPAAAHESHLNDPVDEAKLRSWTGAEPIETSLVADGKQRLVAVYKGVQSSS